MKFACRNSRLKNPYKSSKWLSFKRVLISRRGASCERCGLDNCQLSVHHRTQILGVALWEYKEKDLVVVCQPCHAFTHSKIGISEGWFTPFTQ